ncbi:hypothetical protein [Paraburkholderia xenovorans]|uniref:hypothetical protein n=1 Tax=Paraburkholderia xenovorans TaxID=36873 RepID=UPI0038B8D25D
MEFDAFIRQAERDAKVVDALYIARHMLATYHGLIVHSVREQLKMDFSPQIEQIDTALRPLGIDVQPRPLVSDDIGPPFNWPLQGTDERLEIAARMPHPERMRNLNFARL